MGGVGVFIFGEPPPHRPCAPPGSVDFDKDCEDPEYKPLAGTAKEVDDEVFGGALPPLNLPPLPKSAPPKFGGDDPDFFPPPPLPIRRTL